MQKKQPLTIREAVELAASRFSSLSDASPMLEAELLLASVLEKPRTHLIAWPDKRLSDEQQHCFHSLVDRRSNGEPLAYITGRREFWSLEFDVTPATLIPRPETETLVELALERLPADKATRVADLGTGSGAIAAAIANDRPFTHVWATDNSPEALSVASGNFLRLGLSNIDTLAGNWLKALPGDLKFDLIVSNPPYVAEDDPHLQKGGLPWEPDRALSSGVDGLNDIRVIIKGAVDHLRTGGWLLLEHGLEQGASIRKLMKTAGYSTISTWNDLENRERISGGIRPSQSRQARKGKGCSC